MKIKEIYDFLNTTAPYDTQLPWDNSGLMTGSADDEAGSIMLCLDCTNDVIQQAVANDCSLIISHHPLIFGGVNCIEKGTPLYNAVRNDITVISCHTNLDMAKNGVNDVLCEKLSIKNIQPLYAEGLPVMRKGIAEYESARAFSCYIADVLGQAVRCCDSGRTVNNVAVCGGSGGDFIKEVAAAGCDTFVTGEVKHHQYLEAMNYGINLIVAGHFSTEVCVLEELRKKSEEAFPEHAVYVASEKCPYETVV